MPFLRPSLACLAMTAVSSMSAAPVNLTFALDAGFGSNMVLQQAPAQAAVYGYLPPGATGVTVQLYAGSVLVATVSAALNATSQPYGDSWGVRPCPSAACPPYNMEAFTPLAEPLPTWKALLPPTPAGENYTVIATCVGCPTAPDVATLTNVAFGDVWYCSGQSNAWLPVINTFSRNDTVANITAGMFLNARVMAGNSGNIPYRSWPPQYGGEGGSNPWMTAQQATPAGCVDSQNCPLFSVSGTCWYFIQSLIEAGVTYPIGVIDTAIGGQRIEEYMNNASIGVCSDRLGENIPWWDAQLFGQQVMPFVDTTIKGWVWYQGENNMGGVKGNALANVGYGCEQRELVSGWRSAWSVVPNTTDPLAPFGIVTLATSGSEGGPNMGAMRWAQTMNAGVLPSAGALPNTFIAQAYDLDDPWGPASGPCFGPWFCCGSKYNSTACAGRESLCAPACAAAADTKVAMGGIHPRDKRPVGARLAQAAYNTVYGGSGAITGPTLAGCSVTGSSLQVRFNSSLLRSDTVTLQPIPPFIPPSSGEPLGSGGSQVWVQTNASLFCMEVQCVTNATTGQCIRGLEYCPTWAGGDGTPMPSGLLDTNWTQVNITLSSTSNAIEVDLTPLGGLAPTAIRYAWGLPDCCDHTDPNLYVTHGCVAACPIMSSSGLPANPWQAKIVSGTCECVAPQVCEG